MVGFGRPPSWRTVDALGGNAGWGVPIFPGRSALLGPAFRPYPSQIECLARAAREREAVPVASLSAVVRTFKAPGPLGRYESRGEYEARLVRELDGSRDRLERALEHPVTALAWPWGERTPELERRARAAGYTLLFTVEPRACERGDDSLAVPRVEAQPDTAWLASLLAIYSRPSLGRIYARLHPPRFPS